MPYQSIESTDRGLNLSYDPEKVQKGSVNAKYYSILRALINESSERTYREFNSSVIYKVL